MATTYKSVEEHGAAIQVNASPNQCYMKFIGLFAITAIFNDLILLPIITILIFYELTMRGGITDIDSTFDLCYCNGDFNDFCSGPYCDCSNYDDDSDMNTSIWALAWGYDFGIICLSVLGIFITICATSWSIPKVFAEFVKLRMTQMFYIATLVLRTIGVICSFIFIASYPTTTCSCDTPCTVDMSYDWNAYIDLLGVFMRIYIACGIFFLCTKRCLLILIRNIKIDVSMQYLEWHYIKIERLK